MSERMVQIAEGRRSNLAPAPTPCQLGAPCRIMKKSARLQSNLPHAIAGIACYLQLWAKSQATGAANGRWRSLWSIP